MTNWIETYNLCESENIFQVILYYQMVKRQLGKKATKKYYSQLSI